MRLSVSHTPTTPLSLVPPPLSLVGPSSGPRSSLDSPHPTHSQTRFPHWFQPRFPSAVSDLSFHKAIYSQHSNTDTARACASERDPHKGFCPWAFSPSQPKHREAFALLLEPWAPALALGVPHPAVPQALGSFVMESVTGHILLSLWAAAQPAARKSSYLHQVCPSTQARCNVVTGI